MVGVESDAKLERSRRGPYKVGKPPKSTYYDKWGPSGSWTMAAKGTPKLESFFNQEAEGNWGAAKRYARNNCNYTWSRLQETVHALDSVDLKTIRRFAQKMW